MTLVDRILAAGYLVEVWDEEDQALPPSSNRADVLDAIGHTDWTILYVRDSIDRIAVGWVTLVHEPEGTSVSDYADNPIIHDLVSPIVEQVS